MIMNEEVAKLFEEIMQIMSNRWDHAYAPYDQEMLHVCRLLDEIKSKMEKQSEN